MPRCSYLQYYQELRANRFPLAAVGATSCAKLELSSRRFHLASVVIARGHPSARPTRVSRRKLGSCPLWYLENSWSPAVPWHLEALHSSAWRAEWTATHTHISSQLLLAPSPAHPPHQHH
jgi:hypothetical protein